MSAEMKLEETRLIKIDNSSISGIPGWLRNSKNLYLVVTNTRGEVLFSNEHYVNTFLLNGKTPKDLKLADQISKGEVASFKDILEELSINRPAGPVPVQVINKHQIRDTGRYKSIKWECSLLSDPATDEPAIMHVGHDVIAVEKEQLSEEYFDKSLDFLFDDLQIGVVVQDETSAILLSNTKAEELLGLTKDQLYGRTFYDEDWKIIKSEGDSFPPDELPAVRAIAEKEHIKNVIMGVLNPEHGFYVWLQVDANPLLDKKGNVLRVVTTFIDISQRKDQEEALKEALKEKTTLLSEIHHRVKNNLAIVSGLLELQSMEVDLEHKLPLQRSINRIHSIAMVHELMYETERLSSVNIKHYLNQLIPAIEKTMQTKNEVAINLDLEEYQLNINQAIPLGLLFNELLTNSFKYAFLKIFDGRIDISLKFADNKLHFTYKDNGPGFKAGQSFSESSSLGLNLIRAQLDQLHADYNVETNGKFELEFTFKISERGPHSNM